MLRAETSELARTLPDSLGLLTSEVLDTAIAAIVDSRRLLCVANGLSAPLAIDLAMRLTAAGRSSEFISDALGQQIAARQLTRDDTVVIISGPGANDLSLRVATRLPLPVRQSRQSPRSRPHLWLLLRTSPS